MSKQLPVRRRNGDFLFRATSHFQLHAMTRVNVYVFHPGEFGTVAERRPVVGERFPAPGSTNGLLTAVLRRSAFSRLLGPARPTGRAANRHHPVPTMKAGPIPELNRHEWFSADDRFLIHERMSSS